MRDRLIPFCLAFTAAVTWLASMDADARGRRGGFVGRVLSAPARAVHGIAHHHHHHRALGVAVFAPSVFAFTYPGRYYYPGRYFYMYPAPAGLYTYPAPVDVYHAPPPAYGYPYPYVYSYANPYDPVPGTPSTGAYGIATQDMRVLSGPYYAIDGGTFVADNVQYRLQGIDTPELGAPHAGIARARLQALLDSGPVTVHPVATDKYGRTVAEVVAAGVNVVEVLRSEGYAN